jgi:hypothetical protein
MILGTAVQIDGSRSAVHIDGSRFDETNEGSFKLYIKRKDSGICMCRSLIPHACTYCQDSQQTKVTANHWKTTMSIGRPQHSQLTNSPSEMGELGWLVSRLGVWRRTWIRPSQIGRSL